MSPLLAQTWRPRGEPICIEIYSTGRANVSKARNYTDLLESFSRMIPELLRYSSSALGVVDTTEDMNEFEDDTPESHPALLQPPKESPEESPEESPKESPRPSSPPVDQVVNDPSFTTTTRPLDRLKSMLQQSDTTSSPSSGNLSYARNAMVHRVQYDMDSDEDMYDDLYNDSTTMVPDWWQANEATHQPKTQPMDRSEPANDPETPFVEPPTNPPAKHAKHATARHRIIQRLYQHNATNAVPVSKSKQNRFAARVPTHKLQGESSHAIQSPPATSGCSYVATAEEDSDDPMSGWALGPGV